MAKGLPTFYLTINPADIHNPLVKLLAGNDIDIDSLLPSEIPQGLDQTFLIAKNPSLAAEFFNMYMKKFCKVLLGYVDEDAPVHSDGGVLGHVNAYYSCVEAQGQGSLHCHMMVWIEGSLNCDEIKQKAVKDAGFAERLIRYLDNCISSSIPVTHDNFYIPSDAHHPCSVRGLNNMSFDDH